RAIASADDGGDGGGGEEGHAAPAGDATPDMQAQDDAAVAEHGDGEPDADHTEAADDVREARDDAQSSQDREEPVRSAPRRNAEAAGTGERAESRPASAGAAQRAVQQAREHLKTLSGHDAESVSSF